MKCSWRFEIRELDMVIDFQKARQAAIEAEQKTHWLDRDFSTWVFVAGLLFILVVMP